ncbi:hypothetical protein KR044_000784 [Drosophila immigrans]|nr:hypothetical protein KR044_000784 [Drosophila immigrans]
MRKLQVQVLTRDGRKNIFETDRFRNVADLKRRIGRSMNVPMTFSKLTYKGRVLSNDSILEDEGVKRLSTLELYWQPLVLTPKQYREKELEMEKLEQKQRHLSRLADNSDPTTAKKANRLPRPGPGPEHVQVKQSPSDENVKPVTEEATAEEPSSESSEELDFLAVYWCCPKKTRPDSETKLEQEQDQNGDRDREAADEQKNLVAKGQSESSSSSSLQRCDHADSEEERPLAEVLDQRCLSWKPSFRPGVRLAAGRMSHSIISNIRKHQKSSKK